MIGEDRGLKILVDMAKRGEIDPWNVDIIQVTDRYLALLQAEEFHDLREYGRLLFYASVLLRIKAEVVGGREQTWTDGFDDFIEGDEFDMYAGNGQDLEVDALRARLTFQNGDVGVTPRIPRPRRRPLTLTDLIRELKRMETLQRIHSQRPSISGQGTSTAEAIKSTHTDDLERDISLVRKQLEALFRLRKRVDFQQLLSAELSISRAFLSVLFLASRFEICLEQEKLYDTLYIRQEE